jgi:hypothetical protein
MMASWTNAISLPSGLSSCRRSTPAPLQAAQRIPGALDASNQERPPAAGADARDRALYAKLKDYLIRMDDDVVCKTCQKRLKSLAPVDGLRRFDRGNPARPALAWR